MCRRSDQKTSEGFDNSVAIIITSHSIILVEVSVSAQILTIRKVEVSSLIQPCHNQWRQPSLYALAWEPPAGNASRQSERSLQ